MLVSIGWSAATSQPTQPRLRFCLEAKGGPDAATESFVDSDRGNIQVIVCKDPVLDERAISHASLGTGQDGTRVVDVELTDAGGEIFKAFTTVHVNDRVAFIFDGKLLCAATIMTPIGKKVQVPLPDSMDEKNAGAIVKSMREAMEHAATQPVSGDVQK